MNIYDFTDQIVRAKPKIRLDIGQPDVPVCTEIIDATIVALKEGKTRYTSSLGIMELRERLAEKHKVGVENVIVTIGGKSPITSSLYYAKKPAIINPAWPVYGYTLDFFAKKYSVIDARFEDGWQPDLSPLDKSHDMLVLNYPNNPTGMTLSHEKYKETCDLAEDLNLTILADEVYSDIIFEKHKSFASHPNVIYVNSFSKTFSMTGYRIGYAVSSPENIEKIKKFGQIAYTCPPEFTQWAALASLEYEAETSRRISELYEKRRDIAMAALEKKGIPYVCPKGAFYVFPKISMDGMAFALRILEKGVSVFPGEAFGDFKNYFRLSLVSEKIPEAVDIMEEVLKKG